MFNVAIVSLLGKKGFQYVILEDKFVYALSIFSQVHSGINIH